MEMKITHTILKIIFTLFIVISASGELTLNETVVHSMNVIQMPVHLLYLLGVLKILGLIVLWFSPLHWLKEWAYAGFVFDFIGAIYCFVMAGQLIIPDIIMAPLGLVLCIALYIQFKHKVKTDQA